MMNKHTLCIVTFICWFISCKPMETDLAAKYFMPLLPSYIEIPKNLKEIPLEGVQLGEKLFFDANLSRNGQVSCATCHQKSLAFGDGEVLSNKGVSAQVLPRHTPVLFNLAWQKSFFWDGGTPDLSSQALAPLFSEHEMDADLNNIIAYLKSNTEYQKMFKNSFSSGEINSLNILKALSWYQLSLISFDTKYDRFRFKNDSSILTKKELSGLKIYENQCNSCHTLPIASSYDFANNELDTSFDYPFEDERLGRNRITNNAEDLGKYKIPSLRNLSFSGPYMHDGRFKNLDEVLIHYQNKVTKNITTTLNGIDKENLKSFLLTLNDSKFINN